MKICWKVVLLASASLLIVSTSVCSSEKVAEAYKLATQFAPARQLLTMLSSLV